MMMAKEDQIKKNQEIINKQKSDNEKLHSLVQSKDVTIKVQNEQIHDFSEKLKEKDKNIQKSKTTNAELINKVAELKKAIHKLGLTADSGYSMSKSRIWR